MQTTHEIDCVSATIRSLEAALSGATDEFPPVFTDEKVLSRPPFNYVHALAKFFAERKPSLGWTELLFDGHDHEHNSLEQPCLSKKEKLSFLSRLLGVVSEVSGRRLDVLVAPSKILCGQDVSSTHEFLRALASSAMASEEEMGKAVKYVLKEGDTILYKRGVRTRKAFTSLQAIVRGRRVRRQYQRKASRRNINETAIVDEDGDASRPNESKSSQVIENDRTEKALTTKSKSKSDEDALLESYQVMLLRKSEVEEQLKVAEARLNRENDKLIRILNLGTKHKTRTNIAPYSRMPRPPLSAPSMGRTPMNDAVTNASYEMDEAFSEKITNFSERQRTIKQKERRIDERESRLKQRFSMSKQKEAELKLQEERITELAGKMRKQQLQLKEQKLQFERSKVLDPVVPPEETTRPCLLCTEKKMQMREMRNRVRQRTRALGQREADVIGRAHALRRKEIRLAKREQVVAEMEEQHSFVDDFLLDCEDDEPPREKHRRRSRKNENRNEPDKKALPDLREDSNQPLSKGARKRRRKRSPREGRPSTPNLQANVEQNLRQPSFAESITTIIEETPAEEQEDSIVEEVFKEADAAGSAATSEDTVNEIRSSISSKENVVPTDISKARRQLGISKSMEREERRSTFQKEPVEILAGTKMQIARRVSQPPTPKKRHVFAFERQESQKSDNEMFCSVGGDKGRSISSTTPTRERDKKPRASYEKHDDWISSFDVQMKCAMNRLKDLV